MCKQGFHWWSLLWGLVCRCGWWHWTHLTGSVLCLRSGPNGSLMGRCHAGSLALRSVALPSGTGPDTTSEQTSLLRYAAPRYSVATLCPVESCGWVGVLTKTMQRSGMTCRLLMWSQNVFSSEKSDIRVYKKTLCTYSGYLHIKLVAAGTHLSQLSVIWRVSIVVCLLLFVIIQILLLYCYKYFFMA